MIHINKLKINLLEPEFFVNENEKTVACKLGGIMHLPIGLNEIWMWGKTGFHPNLSVTTIAKCSPEDIFDIDKGKRIALAKAENKISEQFDRELCKLVSSIIMSYEPLLENFVLRNRKFRKHNKEYIDKISNGIFKIKNPLNKGTVKYVSNGKKK